MYYKDKIKFLENIFDTKDIVLKDNFLIVRDTKYPIINDVIILSEPNEYTCFVKKKLQVKSTDIGTIKSTHFAEDIQYTFGAEWETYDKILMEHEKEFTQYFDIVNLTAFRNACVCDLGCGNGRWSYFLKDICKKIILIDFSDAIFIARKNLSGVNNCLFFMCDLKKLPFKNNFVDFLFCLGVLHHLSTPCINEVRNLKKFAPRLLIFLYYSLDNRPKYFRAILGIVTFLRLFICKIRNPIFRRIFSQIGTFFLYVPLIFLGKLMKPLKLSSNIPLYDAYHNKGIERIQQDVYDRFFTRVEQRVSRNDILKLNDTFENVKISNNLPYYHFLCSKIGDVYEKME
ncbi:class I SAM-dependent methyltransferase [bacterium]|nr:class I SAM-dependent methyltransferase [bacterium]